MTNNNTTTIQSTVFESGEQSPRVPGYFASLNVSNVRSFGPEQILNLSDRNGRPSSWTIILGDNGFGKTTLLQCLAALQPVYRQTAPEKGHFHYLAPSCLFAPMNIHYISTILPRVLPSRMSCSVACGSNLKDASQGEDYTGFRVEFSEEGTVSFGAVYVEDEITALDLTVYGYGAARRMGQGQLSERTPDKTTTASLFSEDADLINAEEWYLKADYSEKRSPTALRSRRRHQVKDALVKILPDVEDLRISESKDAAATAIVEVKTPFGWVHIQQLSLGYRTLIAWVVDFAHRMFERYPNHKNPLAQPAVVLVDEIDLHLHPRFQRVLMDYLTNIFPNTQFIATAHSPLIVQAADNANIVLLRREGDHTVIDNDVDVIRNWRIDQVLTSDLFGLESARPPRVEPLLEERTKILSKSKLTKKDQTRLDAIEAEIGNLPTGETPDDLEASDIIRQAAAYIKGNRVPHL